MEEGVGSTAFSVVRCLFFHATCSDLNLSLSLKICVLFQKAKMKYTAYTMTFGSFACTIYPRYKSCTYMYFLLGLTLTLFHQQFNYTMADYPNILSMLLTNILSHFLQETGQFSTSKKQSTFMLKRM